MGISSHGKEIIPCIQNIGSGVVGIVACQIVFANADGKLLGAACRDFLLIEAAKLHSGLFHLVINVILGIGGLEIDLHRVLAVHTGGIRYIHSDINRLALVFYGEIGIRKG